ncbi:MAG: hypothetical protein QXL94_00390 [Candidatus Parvarchaeum sp.]
MDCGTLWLMDWELPNPEWEWWKRIYEKITSKWRKKEKKDFYY